MTRSYLRIHIYVLAFLLLISFENSVCVQNLTEISVLHINDFHARYEETTVDSGICKTKMCIGGFSRIYSIIKRIFKQKPNSILLNAGDNFEGTLWYSVHKWNVTQHFFNKLPFDAFTLGNHEFEDNIAGLIPFLEHLKFPVVVANIDAGNETKFQNLIKKSVVIERDGVKIGIIGVILSTIGELTDVGRLVLLDESSSINLEAERLAREEGVLTNIVLSHCGYAKELELARNASSKISIVVGGHSHTFLYTGDSVPGPDSPLGPYPTVVENADGQKILVVQASSYGKYLGNLSVVYNSQGHIERWAGNPIFLDTSLLQDKEINEELLPWKEEVDRLGSKIIGRTLVRLEQSTCPTRECLLGNFITDAMVFAYTNSAEPGCWTNGSIALTHAGGLRSGIDVGNITYNEIVSAQPFKNTVDIGELKGSELKQILESVSSSSGLNLLQVSGLKITYNVSLPEGSRVTSLKLRCRKCQVPVYEDLDEEENYRVILPSFLADGGFGFNLFKIYLKNLKRGPLDINLYVSYVNRKSPIFQEIQGRIQIVR